MLVRGLLPLKVKHCFVKQDASIQGNSITRTRGYEDPIMGTVAGRPKASGYPGAGPGAGKNVKKNGRKMPWDIFPDIFLTLNAHRGRGGEAAAPSGRFYGTENV